MGVGVKELVVADNFVGSWVCEEFVTSHKPKFFLIGNYVIIT